MPKSRPMTLADGIGCVLDICNLGHNCMHAMLHCPGIGECRLEAGLNGRRVGAGGSASGHPAKQPWLLWGL